MDLATGELIRVTRFDKCVMTRLVISRVEQLAAQQDYRTLKFFNRKKEEMILEDIDLLAGLQEVRDHVVNEDEMDLPTGDGTPGGLLSGPDKPLEVDEGINQEEIADLLQDVADHENLPEVVEDVQDASNDNDYSLQNKNEEDDPEK